MSYFYEEEQKRIQTHLINFMGFGIVLCAIAFSLNIWIGGIASTLILMGMGKIILEDKEKWYKKFNIF